MIKEVRGMYCAISRSPTTELICKADHLALSGGLFRCLSESREEDMMHRYMCNQTFNIVNDDLGPFIIIELGGVQELVGSQVARQPQQPSLHTLDLSQSDWSGCDDLQSGEDNGGLVNVVGENSTTGNVFDILSNAPVGFGGRRIESHTMEGDQFAGVCNSYERSDTQVAVVEKGWRRRCRDGLLVDGIGVEGRVGLHVGNIWQGTVASKRRGDRDIAIEGIGELRCIV